MTEKERWDLLFQLDMGYSLDGPDDDEYVEDIITDEDEFYQASCGLYSRKGYLLAKADIELYFAELKEPPRQLIDRLLKAKSNVELYISKGRK